MADIRQSLEYANYLRKIGWIVERIDNTNYFIKKIPLIGSVLKIQRPEEIKYDTIKNLARKYRTFQIIVEPNLMSNVKNYHDLLLSQGFKLSKSPYLPTKTLQIDLTQTKEEIFSAFKKDARLALRKTKDLGFKIYDLSNLKEFRKTWKKAVGWKRYVPPLKNLLALKKAFGEDALFISAGLPAEASAKAGAIFLLAEGAACYWQAFTNKEGRKQQTQYQVVWEGIRWAKNQGCKIFDFEGIFNPRFPNKSWLGFTHFKKSFGGYKVEYSGCYTKWLLPSK